MKKYIEQVRQRPPHERRQAALKIAASVSGVIFLGWLATLGVRLATPAPKTAQQSSFEHQVASVFSAFSFGSDKPNSLEVSSSTNL
ncbi:MAG TPA: hypothetical protein VN701_01175 [Candidatus Paceibacterota bacterium]|nr:hypothetical protein [Candidatus Paceibacterota bacterium]